MKLKDLILQEVKGIWGDEPKNEEIGTPVIKTNNMTYEGYLDISDLTYRKIPSSKLNGCLLQNGDMLIEKSGGTKTHSVGYINFFNLDNEKYVANNFILILRPNKMKVDPKYLFYQLKYKYESGQIEHLHNQTTGIQNLKVQMYLDQEVKCCPLSNQERIVLALENIEKIIAKEQQELVLLDFLIKSRFNEMFSAFPKVELSQISQIIMGQSPESTAYNDDGIGLPFFQGKADYGEKYTVVKHYTKKWNKEAKRGYVLMSVRAPVGPVNIASTDCAIGRGLCAMNAKPNKANNEFLYNALNSMQQEIVLSGKDGSTFAAINKDQVYKLLLPQAPIELQNDFSEFVHRVDKLKFSL